MRQVVVYSRPGCHLCEIAVERLREIGADGAFALRELDISRDEELHRAYFERIPVIVLDGEELCEYELDEALLRERLESGAVDG
ncbi:MAG TPA: glutaredoxin family protein [Solirubrobacteraceae bacterium]|nr:glutaredoxin family protein [Solirubrobacteraceae bacterium]